MGCRQTDTHATLTPRQTAEPTSKAEASGWSRLPRSSKPSCSVPETASRTRLGGDGGGGGGGSGKAKAESAAAAAAEGGGIGACARSAATTSEERAAQPTIAPCATTISSVACLKCGKYDSVASLTTRQSYPRSLASRSVPIGSKRGTGPRTRGRSRSRAARHLARLLSGLGCAECRVNWPRHCTSWRALHAHLGGDSRDEQVRHASRAQLIVQRSAAKGAFARLVQHELARDRRHLIDDRVARLARDEKPAPCRLSLEHLANGGAPQQLGSGQVAKVGFVRLKGVDDRYAACTRRREHSGGRSEAAAKRGDVVAEGMAEAALVEEVALPINHDERHAARGRHLVRERLGGGNGELVHDRRPTRVRRRLLDRFSSARPRGSAQPLQRARPGDPQHASYGYSERLAVL